MNVKGNSYIIDFRYLLFDLARIDKETILSTETLLDIIFMLDKRRQEKANIVDAVGQLAESMFKLSEDEQSILAGWVVHAGDFAPKVKELFIQTLKKGDKDMMRGAWVELLEEQYGKAEGRREGRQEGWREGIREGKQEGRREGRQEGWREGKQEGRWDVAKNMVVKGMDVDTIVEVTGLIVDDVLRLKTEDAQKDDKK